MSKSFVFLLFALIGLIGCTRATTDGSSYSAKSLVSFTVPIGLSSQTALPDGKKACYGVKVTGLGIANMPNQCNVNFGQFVGFKSEGQSLSLEVAKGENRTFELIAYLVSENDNCPEWNSSFGAAVSQLQNTYVVGSTSGVSLQNNEETVTISYEFPGVDNNISVEKGLVGCVNKLKGSLYTNGDILDSYGNVLSTSSQTNDGYYSTSLTGDIYGVGFITSGGLLNIGSTLPAKIPEYVYSLTRKPDTGVLYGLIGDGQIVKITLSGSSAAASIVELNSSTCPFSVSNCKVPVWMQSISAGFSAELYGLDHGGNIYALQASGLTFEVKVSEAVRQVSYY